MTVWTWILHTMCGVSLASIVYSIIYLWRNFRHTGLKTKNRWMTTLLYPFSQLVFLASQMWYTLNVHNVTFSLVLAFIAIGCAIVDVRLYDRLLHAERESIEREELARVAEQRDAQKWAADKTYRELKEMDKQRVRFLDQISQADEALAAGDTTTANVLVHHADNTMHKLGEKICENPFIDTMLMMKANLAKKNDIAFHCRVNAPTDLPFKSEELSTIFANLCDNAIRGAVTVPGGVDSQGNNLRWVKVDVTTTSSVFSITVRNSYDKNRKSKKNSDRPHLIDDIDMPDDDDDTTKLIPRHGRGLNILACVAAAHGGTFYYGDFDLDPHATPDIGVWRAIMTFPLPNTDASTGDDSPSS